MAAAYADVAFVTSRVTSAATLDADVIQAALDDAQPCVDLAVYRDSSDLAHMRLAAHLLACRFPDTVAGAHGPVTALAVTGGLSSSFASTAIESDNSSTHWGRLFDSMATLVARPFG